MTRRCAPFSHGKNICIAPPQPYALPFFYASKNIISLSYIVSYSVHKQLTILTFIVGTSDKTIFSLRGGLSRLDAGGKCMGGARDLVTILRVRAVH
jgi:hypothetical protein